MRWKAPPRIKVYEALGAIADGRVMGATEIGARIKSSEGNKIYTVTFEEAINTIGANDNGSYWQGYLGYPGIAYLMIRGKLPFNKDLSEALKGVAWKKINTKNKNNFAMTEAEIYQKVGRAKLEVFANEVLNTISGADYMMPIKRMKPPTG